MGDEKPSPDDVKGDPLACSSQVDDGDDDAGEEDEEYEDFGPIHEVPLPALPPTPLLVASSRATHLHHPETQLDQRHKRLRFDTFARVPPLYILPHRPDHHEVFRKDGKTPAWLPEHLLSTGWLTLFYDLVMVAALHTFSEYHEVGDAPAVGIFWSYFVIIWWLWVSQCVYDIRFSAEDLYHRLCKLLQIFVFVYIGAASGGWEPTSLKQIDNAYKYAATQRNEAASSFLLVAIAYAVSRLISALQYLLLIVVARRVDRPVVSLVVPFLATLVSMAFCVTAAALGDDSIGPAVVKPLLVYSGILIEVVATVWTPFLKSYIPLPAHLLSERMGSLTLIILGEGLLSLVSCFNTVINGFTRGDSMTYVEVFCAVFVVYLIWMMYFTGFDARHWMGRRRIWAWTVLHMPLHFVTMLLNQGMVNVVKFSAFADGADWINSRLNSLLVNQNGTVAPPQGSFQTPDGLKLALQLGKLNLYPPWQQELQDLQNAIPAPDNPNFPAAELIQYIGQIFYQTASIYNVDIRKSMEDTSNQLTALNTTLTGNATTDQASAQQAENLYIDLLIEGYNTSIQGSLWLLPTAGGVLILIGLANMVRYHFKGFGLPYFDLTQILIGVGLALLGLLAIGPQKLIFQEYTGPAGEESINAALRGQNRVYQLVFDHWLLAIVTLVFASFWFGSSIALLYHRESLGQHLVEDEDALPSVRTRIRKAKQEAQSKEKLG